MMCSRMDSELIAKKIYSILRHCYFKLRIYILKNKLVYLNNFLLFGGGLAGFGVTTLCDGMAGNGSGYCSVGPCSSLKCYE